MCWGGPYEKSLFLFLNFAVNLKSLFKEKGSYSYFMNVMEQLQCSIMREPEVYRRDSSCNYNCMSLGKCSNSVIPNFLLYIQQSNTSLAGR